jgi:hypothetical protein
MRGTPLFAKKRHANPSPAFKHTFRFIANLNFPHKGVPNIGKADPKGGLDIPEQTENKDFESPEKDNTDVKGPVDESEPQSGQRCLPRRNIRTILLNSPRFACYHSRGCCHLVCSAWYQVTTMMTTAITKTPVKSARSHCIILLVFESIFYCSKTDDTDACGASYLPRSVRELALDAIPDAISSYEHFRLETGTDLEFDSEGSYGADSTIFSGLYEITLDAVCWFDDLRDGLETPYDFHTDSSAQAAHFTTSTPN